MLHMGKDVRSVEFNLSAFPILICRQVSAQCISISSFLPVPQRLFHPTPTFTTLLSMNGEITPERRKHSQIGVVTDSLQKPCRLWFRFTTVPPFSPS